MGYDIYYMPADNAKEYNSSDDIIRDHKFNYYDCSYLSYNFSGKSLTGENFCDYFYLPDIAGQRTEKIAAILRSVLRRLKKKGYKPFIPNETWKHTWNGVTTGKFMDAWTPDMRVYAYHVKRLIKECEDKENHDTVMVLDVPHPIRINSDDEDMYASSGDETEN